MFNPSNLYAEKIFAEHPLELWALDDRNDYVSLIQESARLLENWAVSASSTNTAYTLTITPTVEDVASFTEATVPIENTQVSLVSVNPGVDGSEEFENLEMVLVSDETFQPTQDFAIGLSVYGNPYVTGVEIGHQIGAGSPVWSGQIESIHPLEWTPVSHTFTETITSPIKIAIKIYIEQAPSTGIDYDTYITGISAGSLSQEFSGTSIGISELTTRPEIPGMSTGTWGAFEAKTYGLSDNIGYYIIDGPRLRARSSTVPMVFGATTSTVLEKADLGNPSLVIPGTQFLNSSGKRFNRTLECWLRINSFSTEPRRILGPTTNTDGLYAHGPFLLLKIGDSYGSHYVGEWSRPMLVDISVSQTEASLMVNAETVVTLDINLDTLSLPQPEDDWIGFYCYDDVPAIEVDCIAIYGYDVPEVIAKKRYIYGQGVVLPDSTNTSYGGSSMVIDYTFANYDKNYSFPTNSKWEYGFLNNLYADKSRVSLPKYSIPEIFLGNKSQSLWLGKMGSESGDTQYFNDISEDHRSIIRMRPSTLATSTAGVFSEDEFSTVSPYILMRDLNILSGNRTSGIYGVFGVDKDSTSDQTLLLIKDKTSDKYLEIKVNGIDVSYVLNGTVIDEFEVFETANDRFDMVSVGLDIEKFKQHSAEAFSLFSDTAKLSMYIGGDPNSGLTDKTFSGNIYEVGLMSKTDVTALSAVFETTGMIDSSVTNTTSLRAHRSAYVFIATLIVGTVSLDIAASGYWEDNVPASIFKKTFNGEDKVSLIQVNVDYPEMTNYTDGYYNTDNALAKFFIAFQENAYGQTMTANRTTVPMIKNGSVSPTTSWKTEKYEVVDGAVISLPDLESSSLILDDISIIVSMEISVDGINLNPVAIRNISLSSISFDSENLRGVGTKFGTQIYPFVETSEDGYVSAENNPYKIYKGNSPYLYLTSKTGISIVGNRYPIGHADYVHRGVLLKVNENLASPYSISSMVMFFRHNDIDFPEVKMPLFEVEGFIQKDGSKPSAYLRFFIQSSNDEKTRGVITCQISLNGGSFTDYDQVDYYWNGNRVATPEMTVNEWGILAISFHELINLDGAEGSIEIHGDQLVNNLSVYSASQSSLQSSAITNTWNSAKYDLLDWENVMDQGGFDDPADPSDDNSWFVINTTVKSASKPANPTEIYRTYLGINKIIVDPSSEAADKAIKVQDCEYIVYNTVGWNKNKQKPV